MRRSESCLTTQLAPVTHYNWRLQSSRDEIVWLIDVRIPWTKFVPTTPLLSYVALRQDLFQPVHCQCSGLDMTAPPQEGKVATLMPLGELVLNMGGLLTITMAPHPGWPEPFQKHSHSVTHNRGDQVKAFWVEKSGNQCWHQEIGPRTRMQRLSLGRCGLANRNIGRHSNAG